MNFATRKQAQRAEIRTRLTAFAPKQRTEASARIAAHLDQIEAWRNAGRVALFAPLPSEPDPGWPGAPTIALPRIIPLSPAIELHRVDSRDELIATHLARGWSLLEPPEDAPRVDPSAIEVALVPGVAFDRRGVRLGRGGGYYDRLLSQFPSSTLCIGVFFSVQELAEVCEEPHDRRLNMIVTEQEVIAVQDSASPEGKTL